MSLTQDLTNYRHQMQTSFPAETLALFDQATDDLVQSGIVDRSLTVGEKAPDFALPNAVGETVRLHDLLARGPVVISFYRGEWCPYCNLELRALEQALPEITALGATLVAISPQTPDHSLSTAEKLNLSFQVLSDDGNQAARAFGLVFQVPEALRSVYESRGIDLPAHNGDASFALPIPATYVLDADGAVRLAFADPDYTTRLEPAEVMTALRTLTVTA